MTGAGAVFSRRRLLGLSGVVALAACTADPVDLGGDTVPRDPDGVLGANVNSDVDTLDFAALRAVSADWVRGFLPMSEADLRGAQEAPQVRALLRAAERGLGTALCLKFPYRGKALPVLGSPAMRAELRRVDAVLPAVMNRIDILVIGNEPFIETRDEDMARINAFYEEIAHRVIAYREEHVGEGGRTQLYMGALNRLEETGSRTSETERWMTFVRDTPALRGVDIHPHLPEPGADQSYLDYVLPRLRADQKFLATEFSLVRFWKKHLRDPVSAAFAKRYGGGSGEVWQVLKNAIDRPFPQRKWDDLLSMTPWFADNSDYLRDQVQRFRQTGKLALATYGVSQGSAMVRDFGPDSMPWLLNSLFCPHTVRAGDDGLPGRNSAWIEDFRALQR